MADGWFETIRKTAERGVWSRGVELARADRVRAEREDAARAVLRVEDAALSRWPTVTLTLDQRGSSSTFDWDCDCGGNEDPCEHVAAGAIALRRARSEGRALPGAEHVVGARLRYELRRQRGGFVLLRCAIQGETTELIEASLRALASRVPATLRVDAEEVDHEIEALLGGRVEGNALIPVGLLPKLLRLLARGREVWFEGKPVAVSLETVGPTAVVEDMPGGFRLRLEGDGDVTEALGSELALCGAGAAAELRPVAPLRLDGRERAELPRGRFYPFDRAAELVQQILPDLELRIPVRVTSRRLPEPGRRDPPRLRLETRRCDNALGVRADIVYGEPPRARLEGGRLVSLAGAVPIRDEPAERKLARQIQGDWGLPVGAEIQLHGADALRLAERLGTSGADLRGSAHRDFVPVPALAVAVELRGDAPAVAFSSGGRQADPSRVLASWEAGESHILLEGGGLAPLPVDWLERHGRALADLLEARTDDRALPTWALPELARFCAATGVAPPPASERLRSLIEDFAGIPRASLPNDFRGALRDYQRRGVDWLCFLRDAELGALLADDMGLGKTLEILCALNGRALVVAPTSVLANWASEISRFRSGLSVCRYHGSGRQLDRDADVTLTSYALLRQDADILAAVPWDIAVLDEAQAIKNPDSQVARAAQRLAATWRVSLTGTPVENRLDELWSQLHFINPGLLGDRDRFVARYGRPIEAGDAGASAALRRRIAPFVLRRGKGEVARELPPRTEVVLRCELDAAEREAYDAVRAATRREVVARLGAGGSVLGALEALLRLRQAACHRGLLPGQAAGPRSSSKLELLLEQLGTVLAEDHRALVFSQWTALLDRIEPLFRDASIDFLRLDGSTRDRAAVVQAFQRDDGPPVLLISLRAGGTGLNLTAADHVFFTDPWWNPAVEAQAADRTHRIGQTKPVLVQRLVAARTVEEGILELHERKRRAAAGALGTATGAGLTREELLALLD